MANKNSEVLHHFIQGMGGDMDQHVESNKSYSYGLNGRLYSHNGVISYSSIKGTKEVFVHPGIVAYLGYWAFEDELIIFVKCTPSEASDDGRIEYEEVNQLIADSFSVSSEISNIIAIDIDPHVNLHTYSIPIFVPGASPLEFNLPLSCVPNDDAEIDFSEYFQEVLNTTSLEVCPLSTGGSFENNKDFIDCIYSIKKDSNGEMFSELLWSGLLNWPMDAKICTHGIYENNFYKRVYFTEYVNPFRVINIKDPNLARRTATELETFQSTVLLQPKLVAINTNGQLKAATNLYTYRLFTENGQVTEFAPFSDSVKILADTANITYEGGDISEVTDKSVTVKCNILSWQNYNEIECIVIEYEAFGAPTAIRSLGIKAVSPVVTFDHFGNEAEFSSDITLSEILVRQNTWKYCSDISSISNKLVTIGLRNDPIPVELTNMNIDFSLHGWDENGETHNCLINPKPYKYRFIDPLNTEKLYFIKQKLYNSIQVFGNFTITLTNSLNGQSINTSFVTTGLFYEEYKQAVFAWLNPLQSTPAFQAKFPNLKIEYIDNKILFSALNPLIETDFSNYNFSYNTAQAIEDIEQDLQFIPITPSSQMVYGAVSLGFSQGNGIRITYKVETEEVMQKTNIGANPKLNHFAPNGKKSFFKGETYRLGLQIFDKKGFQLFTIPLGDIQIPSIGDLKMSIDENGNPIIESTTYRNSRVVENKLVAEKIILNVEVRLSCKVQKLISMYQLVYVERDEDNRTILCQGFSGPMERYNYFADIDDVTIPETVGNKWCLPYFGGPTYDLMGLIRYDLNPNEADQSSFDTRVITHRSLFYFDAPDVIFNKISAEKIQTANISRIARLNTDHSRASIRQSTGENFPSFSRKIDYLEMSGEAERKPYKVNVSVFIEKEGINDSIPIDKAEVLGKGQIMSSGNLDVNHEVSNNALTLAREPWFYSASARRSLSCKNLSNGAKWELFNSSNFSPGYETVVIKSSEEVFSNDFINQVPIMVNPEIFNESGINMMTLDTHGMFNVKINNLDSVYGGRSELAYSRNVFVPLGSTIPVLEKTNNTQRFDVYGDSYTSLFIRNKNGFNQFPVGPEVDMQNSRACHNNHEVEDYRRNGAWCYAVVLETSVETKWTDKDRFDKLGAPYDFAKGWQEIINEAYFQENTLRTYVPKPFKFKDDPNMGNIIAVSEVKLLGDFIDKWTQFKVNNFYELERDKGTGYNLAKYLDQLYAVQEQQSSKLLIDENVMIPSSTGEISMQQGNGEGVTNHEVISDYGTSIRRAIVEIISNSKSIGGFTFFDEKRFEWVKIDQPILIERDLYLKMREIFENNKIIDTEGYFDDEYKETNIRIRTRSGESYMLSFNEKFTVFNGWIEYNNDIYMVWNENIYAPISKTVIDDVTDLPRPDSSIVHQLNKGNFLDFFEEEKTMKLKVTCNISPETVKIYKHWAGIINTDYNVKKVTVETSTGQVRVLNGDHYQYKIREGRHSLPLKNRDDWSDLRGEWATIEIEVESKNNKKVDVFSFINFVRQSYQ